MPTPRRRRVNTPEVTEDLLRQANELRGQRRWREAERTYMQVVTGAPRSRAAYVARIAMAVAYGETSSNLLQPFFLLAILPVMGVGVRIQARDVMGYLVIPFLWVTVYTGIIVTWAPL